MKKLQFIENLDDVTYGDYEEVLHDDIIPELVSGIDSNSSVRCRDGVWRPFADIRSHGFGADNAPGDVADDFDREGYFEY